MIRVGKKKEVKSFYAKRFKKQSEEVCGMYMSAFQVEGIKVTRWKHSLGKS